MHEGPEQWFERSDSLYINLDKLYRIVDTCYYSRFMPYCPILLEDTHSESEKKYHLQVWDINGKMVYTPPEAFK